MSATNEPSVAERFRCATVMLLRGVTAPVWHPIKIAGKCFLDGVNGTTPLSGTMVMVPVAEMVGLAMAVNSIIEAPAQFFVKNPRTKSYVERNTFG